jgi:hypothetical protein
MNVHGNLLEPNPTLLPEQPEAEAALATANDPATVAAAYPDFSGPASPYRLEGARTGAVVAQPQSRLSSGTGCVGACGSRDRRGSRGSAVPGLSG